MRKKDITKLIIPDAPIKPGQMGYAVLNLQIVLDYLIKHKTKISKIEPGHYGPYTEKMLREFQGSHGLFPNGIYTPVTRLRIKEVLDGTHD